MPELTPNNFWILASPLLGIFLAALRIANSYPTTITYALWNFPAWLYFLISAVGGLGTTWFIKVIGTQVIGEAWLNVIILSLLGPALFIGIISRVTAVTARTVELADSNEQLRILRNFINDFLVGAIEREVDQKVKKKIKNIIQNDIADLPNEAEKLIRGVRKLTEAQKEDLVTRLDEDILFGRPEIVLNTLSNYYSVKYLEDYFKVTKTN